MSDRQTYILPALDIAARLIDDWWPSKASLYKDQLQTTEGIAHSRDNKYDTKPLGEKYMIEDDEVKLYYFSKLDIVNVSSLLCVLS